MKERPAESTMLECDDYSLDFNDLYALMWDCGTDREGGTRLYVSEGPRALKWLIADLSGTPAATGKPLRANAGLRKLTYQQLEEGGWAERLNERTFVLLRPPASPVATLPVNDPDDEGQAVAAVDVDAVSSSDGRVMLAGLAWSDWMALEEAVDQATTTPGVYLARTGGQLVYVGMAGERRGRGVRGRLTVYARGRGAVSGLGEAALDRALADESWLSERLTDLRRSGPTRAKDWAAAALRRVPMQLCWVAAGTADEARRVEQSVLVELADDDLWNRLRPKPS